MHLYHEVPLSCYGDTLECGQARAVGGGAGEASGGGGGAFARNCVSKEQQLSAALRQALPGTTYISVQDISGGCGAMFEVNLPTELH